MIAVEQIAMEGTLHVHLIDQHNQIEVDQIPLLVGLQILHETIRNESPCKVVVLMLVDRLAMSRSQAQGQTLKIVQAMLIPTEGHRSTHRDRS